MADDFDGDMGDVSLTLTIEDVKKSIAEAKAEVAKARFEGKIVADTKRLIAEYKVAKQEIERDKIDANYSSIDSGLLLRRSAAIAHQKGVADRAEAAATQSFVNNLLGNGLREQLKNNLALADARKKAEFAAYRENDIRSKRAVRDALRDAKLINREASRVMGSGLRPQAGALQRGVNSFGANRLKGTDEEIKLRLNTDPARVEAELFKRSVERGILDIKAGLNTEQADAELIRFYEEARTLNGSTISVDVRAETAEFLNQTREAYLKAKLRTEEPLRVKVVSNENLDKLKIKIDLLRARFKQPLIINAYVKDNLGKASAKLQAFQAATKLSGFQMGRLGTIVSAVILALGPLAITLGGVTNVLGGLVVGVKQAVGALGVLPGLIGVLGGAFATLKVGFGGVSDSFQAYANAQKASSKASTKTLADLYAVRNATRAVTDANYDLNEQQRQSNEQILGIQKQQADTQKQLQQSTLSIRVAEASRAQTLTDLNRQLRDLKLNTDDAAQSVRDAQIASNNAAILGDPEEIERARIALEKAKNAAKDQGEDNSTLLTSGANIIRDQANAEVQAAVDARTDLNTQLGDLDKQLTQTRLDNARAEELAKRRVTDAEEALTDARNKSVDAVDALNTALAKLSPSARNFVDTVNELRGAWQGVRTAVQEALFDGAGEGFRRLSSSYIPLLTIGLSGIATALNGLSGEANGFFTSTDGMDVMRSILDNIRLTLEALQPAVKPFLDVLTTIIAVGTAQLPGMVTDFTTLLNTFNDFIQASADDGSLGRYFQTGVTTLGDFLELGKELLGFIGNIGTAMNQNGASPIQALADGLSRVNDLIGAGTPGQDKLVKFFTQLSDATALVFNDDAMGLILQLLQGFGDTIETIAPSMSLFVTQFVYFLTQLQSSGLLTDILTSFFDVLTQIFSQLSDTRSIDVFRALGDAILEVTHSAEGTQAIESFFTVLRDILPQLIADLPGFVESMLNLVNKVLNWLVEHPDFATKVLEFMLAMQVILPVLVPLAGALVAIFMNWEVAALVAAVVGLTAGFVGLYELIKNGDWAGIGKALFTGLFYWISPDVIKPLLTGFVGNFVSLIKELLGIHSPSTVMAEIGGFLLAGLFQGLGDVGGRLVGLFTGLPARIAGATKGLFNGLVSSFVGALNALISLWNNFSLDLKFPDSIKGVPLPGFLANQSIKIETPNITPIKIPALAQGGTTDGPSVVMVGDNKSGRERIKPEDADGFSTDTRIIDGKLDDLAQKLSSAGGQQTTLVIGVGVREVLEQLDAQHARGQLASGGYSGLLDRLASNGSVTELDRLDARTGGLAARALSAGLATIR